MHYTDCGQLTHLWDHVWICGIIADQCVKFWNDSYRIIFKTDPITYDEDTECWAEINRYKCSFLLNITTPKSYTLWTISSTWPNHNFPLLSLMPLVFCNSSCNGYLLSVLTWRWALAWHICHLNSIVNMFNRYIQQVTLGKD